MKYFFYGLLFSLLFGCTTNKSNKEKEVELKKISELDAVYINKQNILVLLPEGTYMQGSNGEAGSLPREFPQHIVNVHSFYMQQHEVTNAEFERFVKATGYVTTAEKPIDWEVLKQQLPEDTPKPSEYALAPGALVFVAPKQVSGLRDYSQWWQWVQGANWKHPLGPGSNLEGKEDHPVVQVSYTDAKAYAAWAGMRLPTEAEWEWAARGGIDNATYPWGNERVAEGDAKCNFWTGYFPLHNTEADGYYYTAPVKSYKPNGFGLFDMAGNVWEMCADKMNVMYYQTLEGKVTNNPRGSDTCYFPMDPEGVKRVMRGGSFLCNDSYCSSYRVAARMGNAEDTGMCHTGFRLVKDVE